MTNYNNIIYNFFSNKKTKKILFFIIILIITFTISFNFLDVAIHNFISKNIVKKQIILIKSAKLISKIVSSRNLILLNICLLLISLTNTKLIKKTILSILIQLFTNAFCLQILKYIFARSRPFYIDYAGYKNYGFNFFEYNFKNASFPSAHSFNTWSLIASIIFIFDNKINKNIKFIIYTIGIMIPLSRIILDVHFLSDVIAGSLFGYYCTIIFLNLIIKKL